MSIDSKLMSGLASRAERVSNGVATLEVFERDLAVLKPTAEYLAVVEFLYDLKSYIWKLGVGRLEPHFERIRSLLAVLLWTDSHKNLYQALNENLMTQYRRIEETKNHLKSIKTRRECYALMSHLHETGLDSDPYFDLQQKRKTYRSMYGVYEEGIRRLSLDMGISRDTSTVYCRENDTEELRTALKGELMKVMYARALRMDVLPRPRKQGVSMEDRVDVLLPLERRLPPYDYKGIQKHGPWFVIRGDDECVSSSFVDRLAQGAATLFRGSPKDLKEALG